MAFNLKNHGKTPMEIVSCIRLKLGILDDHGIEHVLPIPATDVLTSCWYLWMYYYYSIIDIHNYIILCFQSALEFELQCLLFVVSASLSFNWFECMKLVEDGIAYLSSEQKIVQITWYNYGHHVLFSTMMKDFQIILWITGYECSAVFSCIKSTVSSAMSYFISVIHIPNVQKDFLEWK